MTLSSGYAHLERERRFLLPSAPPGPVAGGVHTLGQKVRPDETRPSTVEHTTLYLDRGEDELLRALPGDTLTRTRTWVPWSDLTPVVDVFSGEFDGLVLTVVELGDRLALPSGPPLAWLAEVTDDERFTGGALARGGEAARGALSYGAVELPTAVAREPCLEV